MIRAVGLILFALGYVGIVTWFYIRVRNGNGRHDAAHDFPQGDSTTHGEAE
jgi:cbb3-type cytochrome oxidase subunit 3